MATWMYAGTAQRRNRERRLEQRRRRDMLTPPAFRLLSRGDTKPDGDGETDRDLDIQPADPRPLGLLIARESAGAYLDKRPRDRRRQSLNGHDRSTGYRVSPSSRPGQQRHVNYRRARRLPPISPQRLAVYTVLILIMAGLIVVAAVHAATSGSDSAATDPVGQGMVGE